MESHAFAQVEAPSVRVQHLPALGETWDDLEVLVAPDQAFHHVGEQAERDRVAQLAAAQAQYEVDCRDREAAAVAMKAVEQGLARIETTYEQEFQRAMHIIKRSRDMTKRMMEEGFIPEPPADDGTGPEVDLETVKSAY